MGRSSVSEAIILRTSRFAEYHKRLTLLTGDRGIVDAIAYGAFKSKSKLAGLCDNFVSIRAFLYFEPVKKQYKLTDAELVASNDGIRTDLVRFYAASLICELVSVTYAGGDEHLTLFPLLASGLALLDSADRSRTALILIQLLGRFFDAIGYPPPWQGCERCGASISDSAARFVTPGGLVLCTRCRGSDDATISPGGFALLAHSLRLSLGDALKVSAEPSSVEGVKRGLLRIAERVAESPLKSLRGSESFL